MRKIYLIFALLLSTAQVIFGNCSDEARNVMLNAGISPEYIKDECNDSKKVSESSDDINDIEVSKDININSFSNHDTDIKMLIGNVDGSVGSIDLSGKINQFIFTKNIGNNFILGGRQIYFTMTDKTGLVRYDLSGFGLSGGYKFVQKHLLLQPQITYYFGNSSFSVFGINSEGTGDGFSLDLPASYELDSVLVGVTLQFMYVGSTFGNIDEDNKVVANQSIGFHFGHSF